MHFLTILPALLLHKFLDFGLDSSLPYIDFPAESKVL